MALGCVDVDLDVVVDASERITLQLNELIRLQCKSCTVTKSSRIWLVAQQIAHITISSFCGVLRYSAPASVTSTFSSMPM